VLTLSKLFLFTKVLLASRVHRAREREREENVKHDDDETILSFHFDTAEAAACPNKDHLLSDS
jgi:hypothetical protein